MFLINFQLWTRNSPIPGPGVFYIRGGFIGGSDSDFLMVNPQKGTLQTLLASAAREAKAASPGMRVYLRRSNNLPFNSRGYTLQSKGRNFFVLGFAAAGKASLS